MKLTTQTLALICVAIASGCVVLAYLHPATDARFGELMGFAGGITTGAFALLNGDKKETPGDSGPKD